MRKIGIIMCICCSFQLHAQRVGEWLELPPFTVGLPAFHDTKNVENKLFSPQQLLSHSSLDLSRLRPGKGYHEAGVHQTGWQLATMKNDTVLYAQTAPQAILYHAVYMDNEAWTKGTLSFTLFENAEIYVNGEKKATHDTPVQDKGVNREVAMEWIPGKHTIIVKSLVNSTSGKLFTAKFNAAPGFEEIPVTFTCSPLRGKAILDVLNGSRVGNILISPSGKYVLVERAEITGGKTTRVAHLYRTDNKEIVYSFYGTEASSYQWVPEKDKLSFLIKEGEGHSCYTYDVEKQQQECLFKANREIPGSRWSPDGSYLIYTTSENYAENKWELRKLAGIDDRQASYRHRTFLCKYDLQTGLHSRLTWGNLSTGLMDISHSGKQIIVSTSQVDYNEYPFRKQSIYLMDIHTHRIDTLWKDRLESIKCSFSPDDSQLLISGPPHAFGSTGVNIGKGQIVNGYDTQLFIYDLGSKTVTPLTKEFNATVSFCQWHVDGHIYMIAGEKDYVHLFRYNRSDGIQRVDCPGDMVHAFRTDSRGKIAMYTASDASYPTRVYTLDLKSLEAKEWDSPAAEQYRDILFGEVKDWDYSYKKGTTIDGRYYLPENFDPSKKYPLIVYYYGGTTPVERTFGGRWPFNLYAANGYVVYVMQPSGTIGFGQEFSARHQNNWGKTTADEIIACTKAFLKAHPFIDAQRVGCMGASYGGFTTMYLQTRTDMFACAISHAGISSISSYWGEGYWGYAYSTNASAHSYPWNRKDIYVDQSPLFNADKVTRPILLLHGTNDVNVPVGESIQFYAALKLLGRDVELVLIRDADHTVVDYNQRIIWNNTILSYFAKYLKQQPAWWEDMYKDKNL